uniref:Uncharacterized protein n=1 Tax=Utricularia reniformis TaxID=192314 RepID=A0A1Y0B4A7_9LAMI|nr:hypothetical protein AEK19_MT2097 [Utricularia reniformis]ART32251.1 hypothetical protein AEK19_MT2097 [Utricularia reniformis]
MLAQRGYRPPSEPLGSTSLVGLEAVNRQLFSRKYKSPNSSPPFVSLKKIEDRLFKSSRIQLSRTSHRPGGRKSPAQSGFTSQ